MSSLPSIYAQYPWLWEPINELSPCGKAIDYHPDFLAIQLEVSSPLTIEYGTFIQPAATIKWPSLLPKLRGLCQQTKDIRLLILLIRAHLAQEGIVALAEGVALLIAQLERWPEALHPHCHDEGEYVPEFRYNALAGLDDCEGCVAELRQYAFEISETESYTLAEFEQWIVREKTLSLAERAKLKQRYDLHTQFFESCTQLQQRLVQLAQLPSNILGTESLEFPHLSALLAPLCRFHQRQQHAVTAEQDVIPLPHASSTSSEGDALAYRYEAKEKLREIRENFAYYEPSSPLSLLLFFAEHSIGLDCQQISHRFPRELLSLLTLEKDV